MLLYAGLLLLCTVVFLALVIWARRGKRTDRHPVCRKCGYDLHGTNLETLPDCPECGTQIYSRKQLRLGNRQPRRPQAYLFGLLALLALAGTMTFAGLWAKDYDWNRVKPVPWLIEEASDPSNPNRADAALTELTRRDDNGMLSYQQRMTLLAEALDYQADKSKAWDDRWGTWVSRGRTDGLVSDADWERYLIQAADFRLKVRERINEGQPFVVSGEFISPFRGDNSITGIDYFTEDALHTVRRVQDDAIIDLPVLEFKDSYGFGTRYFRDHHSKGFDKLPPGVYELTVAATLRGHEPDHDEGGFFSDNEHYEVEEVELKTRFEVFPVNKPQIKAIHDPALKLQAAKYMHASLGTFLAPEARIEYSDRTNHFFVEYGIPSPDIPYPCSFDVEAYIEGVKADFVENVVLDPVVTGSHSFFLTNFRLPEQFQAGNSPDNPPTVDQFTLKLIPNPEYLKRDLDGYEYLDHVIELRDIPIAPYEP